MHILFPLAPIEARSMPAVALGYQCSYGAFSGPRPPRFPNQLQCVITFAKGSSILRGENGEIVFTKRGLIVFTLFAEAKRAK